jgi:hypothetical protein
MKFETVIGFAPIVTISSAPSSALDQWADSQQAADTLLEFYDAVERLKDWWTCGRCSSGSNYRSLFLR